MDWEHVLQEYIIEDKAPFGYSGHDYVTGDMHVERLYRKNGEPQELITSLSSLITLLAQCNSGEMLQALDRALDLAKNISHTDLYNCVQHAYLKFSEQADEGKNKLQLYIACTALATLASIEHKAGTIRDRSFWESLIGAKNAFSATAYFQFSTIDLPYALEHLDALFDSDMPDVEKEVGLRGLWRGAKKQEIDFNTLVSGFLNRRPECEALFAKALGAQWREQPAHKL